MKKVAVVQWTTLRSRSNDRVPADRSAMMRELRKMKEEHLVDIDRGQVTLHHALA